MYFHEWLVRERKLTQKSAKNYSWAVFCYLSKKIGVKEALQKYPEQSFVQ